MTILKPKRPTLFRKKSASVTGCTSILSRVSPAAFADDVQQSHIICASLNRAP